jgi:hypothetical protein
MKKVKVMGALVIHTGASTKTGLATYVRSRQELMDVDYPAYRHAAALWDKRNEGKQPKSFEFPSLLMRNGTSNAKEK